jgi:hypothetical protein
MAFEAFLSRGERPSRARRGAALLASGCAHAAVMLIVGALVARAGAVVTPRPLARLAASGPRVPVRLWNAAAFPGARASTASTPGAAAEEVPQRRLHAGHLPRRRHPRPASPVPSPTGERAPDDRRLAALAPPPLAPLEIPLSPPAQGPGPAATPSETAGARQSAPAPAPAARAPAFDKQVVPTSLAAGLRIYDYFPRLPRTLARHGHQYVVEVDICVSSQGKVDEVLVKQGGNPELNQVLREAILTWRYRPWRWGNMAMPFCHGLRVVYRVD